MTSMENDLAFMDHTEKLVAEMLKSALAPNGHRRCPNGLNVDETIEYVFIDETGEKSQNAPNIEMNGETSIFDTNENELDEVAMAMAEESENQNLDYGNVSDLESLISEGLKKIRLEYPMYPVAADVHTYNNYNNAPVSVVNAPSHMDNSFENMNTPHNGWYGNTMNSRNDECCSPVYQNESNRSIYSEQYWENCPYNGNHTSFDWQSSNGSVLNTTNKEEEAEATKISTDCFEDIEAQIVSEENDIEDEDTLVSSSKISHTIKTEAALHCISTKHDCLNETEMAHLNGNNNLNGASGVSTSTGGAATAHVQICANTPTAIHAAQSTTTTTTTSAAFGVLHQQTSCTTTNFVPNNLANAVLATSPAALYAQSILTSTAHQYLNVFRKEIQQFFTNNINYNAGAPSLNLGFYERLLYAQLLQQQILQQHQQQAAIASLLQQQKIAMQNNAANVAAAAAAAAAAANVASATYMNISVPTTTSNLPSSSHVEIVNSNNDGDNSSATSLKVNISQRNNKDIDSNILVDMAETKNFDEEYKNSILE